MADSKASKTAAAENVPVEDLPTDDDGKATPARAAQAERDAAAAAAEEPADDSDDTAPAPTQTNPPQADAPADATLRPEGQDERVDDAPPGATPAQQREDSEAFVDGIVEQLKGRQLQSGAAHRLIQAVRATRV